MSRYQEFDREFRYLEAVQQEASRAGVKWIEVLMMDLKKQIPVFVKMLEDEENRKLLPPGKTAQ